MTISGYSNAIVDLMLGWLKGLANWVLRLFNLAGSVRVSPLLWLSHNWLKLLVFFLVLGVVLDRLIWLIRWRPYWVWFRKERVIVNDERFFANADMDKADDWEGDLASNWDEHDYIVASTVVKRQSGAKDRKSSADGDRPRVNRRRPGTKVQRHVPKTTEGDRSRGEGGYRSADSKRSQERKKAVQEPRNIFEGELKKRNVSDSYEDEVFNVSSLPAFDEYDQDQRARRRPKQRRLKGTKV